MGEQAKKRKHQEVTAETGSHDSCDTGKNTTSRWSEWFGIMSIIRNRVHRKRLKPCISWHQKEEERRRRLSSACGETCGETPSILRPRLGGGEEKTLFRYGTAPEHTLNEVKESADICHKYAYNFDQTLDSFSSKTAPETTKAPDFLEPAISNDLNTDSVFSIDEVNAAVAILTLISDICRYGERLSTEDQAILRNALKRMPYLLTSIGRQRKPEQALMFQIKVYENPESASWGTIESFDTLQVMLELLERFDSFAELYPREGPGGIFIA
jgi:hypothetical protein